MNAPKSCIQVSRRWNQSMVREFRLRILLEDEMFKSVVIVLDQVFNAEVAEGSIG